ncbi:MAG: phosphoglycolate phosphatase [Sphingomonadales bacterium]|nr:phosphoglycolate phosphatase [Sphingomonadales bacterium]
MTADFPFETVIFDLDGTLVDTAPDLTHALNHVLVQEGRSPVALEDVRHMVGYGARALIRNGLEKTGAPGSDEDIERLLEDYLNYYARHMAEDSRLFDGAGPVLAALKERDVRLGICTNKMERMTFPLLAALDIMHFFDAVLGGDSLAVRKPNPAHLTATIERAGGIPDRTLFVGDSEADVAAARAANVPVIAVSFGYSALKAEDLGADLVIHAFDDFWAAAEELAAQA